MFFIGINGKKIYIIMSTFCLILVHHVSFRKLSIPIKGYVVRDFKILYGYAILLAIFLI